MNNTFKAYAADDHLLFLGSSINTQTHKHQFLQLIISRQLKSCLRLHVDQHSLSCNGILLAPNTPHQFTLSHQDYVIILVDPTSLFGRCLEKHYLQAHALYQLLPNSLLQLLCPLFDEIDNDVTNSAKYLFIWNKVLQSFHFTQCRLQHEIHDPRIAKALQIIHSQKTHYVSLSSLAQSAYLSPSRFSHLFKEVTGYPLKNYLLFQKVLLALALIAQGNLVTNASLNAGFDTPSHLSMSCKKMIGINPNTISQVSVFLKVFNFYPPYT